jgi:hypothetical protein
MCAVATHHMLWVESSDLLASLVDRDGPLPIGILIGFDDLGRSPHRQLHGMGVPLHKDSKLLCRSVSRPLLREREKGKMVRPVRKVKRKIFVSISPNVANLRILLYYQGSGTDRLEVSR